MRCSAASPTAPRREVVAALPEHLKVVDLSADFRLADPEVYAEWYGRAHGAVALQAEAVYGLTELARDEVRHRPPRCESRLLPDLLRSYRWHRCSKTG